MTDIKPLYKSDLIAVAKQLPPMKDVDHERQILYHFRKSGWQGVNTYIDYVYLYHKYSPVDPVQTLRRTLFSWLTDCVTQVKSWLIKTLNHLNK